MTRKEFIKTCQTAGYCKKQTAEQYAFENKDRELTEDDFIKVHRLETAKTSHKSRFRGLADGNGYTTKSYISMAGNDKTSQDC